MSAQGCPKGEFRRAQHEGAPRPGRASRRGIGDTPPGMKPISTEPCTQPRPGRLGHRAGHLLGDLVKFMGLVGLIGLGLATAAHAETLLVGPDGAQARLDEALRKARDGDVIELLPGNYRGVRLMLENRRLTLRGVGDKKPVLDGERKSTATYALVLVRGGEVALENIEIRGARANDGEGAGVRLEGGRLKLKGCAFYDNENSLVTTADDKAEVEIENTQFGQTPQVEGALHHLLNIGRIAKLSVTGSRFQAGFEGHMIKSRARETDVRYSFIHDGGAGGSSYEIDLPLGGVVTLIGNVIGQSPKGRNRVMVAYGSDGNGWPRNALYMAHNTLLNYQFTPAWFLRVWGDQLPAGTEIVAVNNLLVGGGVFSLGNSGRFEGNHHALRSMLADPDTYAFELPAGSMWRGKGVDPGKAMAGRDLSPGAEFAWPMGTKPLLPGRSSWSPGAFQK